MKTTLYIYVGIFVLLFIPLMGVVLNGLLGKKKKNAGPAAVRNAALAGAAIVLLGALCVSLYFITIDRQPWLVIDRVVNGLLQQQDAVLVEKQLITADCLAQDVPAARDTLSAAKVFAIGDKTQSGEGENLIYSVQPDKAEDTVILVEVAQTEAQATVVGIDILTGEEAAELIKKDNFHPFN